MHTISLCMIVKNEQQVLARCLDSVKDGVDEIIIMDTGSTDRTKEIAGEYTDKVFETPWINDFSDARNKAFAKATMDYQMWLDADDVLPPEELEKLLELKRLMPADIDMVTMKYYTHFDENDRPVATSTRERLFRRQKDYKWIDPVHECIPLSGNLLHSDIVIHHRQPPREGLSTRNLDIYEALETKGERLTPRQQYYFARELQDHGNYAKAVYYFEGFLDEGKGWVEDNIGACNALGVCYRLLGRENKSLESLLRSFRYDAPRAQLCCEVGYHYKNRGEFAPALAWFDLATRLKPEDGAGFISPQCSTFIPNIEACVCCYNLGRFEQARDYNEKAASFKPESPAVEQNRAAIKARLG